MIWDFIGEMGAKKLSINERYWTIIPFDENQTIKSLLEGENVLL